MPGAALRDPAPYEVLALFDALRIGRARDQWSVCFAWRASDAFDVEIVDYT